MGSRGARAHDTAKLAEATQSRLKLRTTRSKLGEGVALEQLLKITHNPKHTVRDGNGQSKE